MYTHDSASCVCHVPLFVPTGAVRTPLPQNGGVIHCLSTSSPLETEGVWNPAIGTPATGAVTAAIACSMVSKMSLQQIADVYFNVACKTVADY